jgi:hypothetical protein
MAQWRQQTPGVQLDPLAFLQSPSPREKSLETVGVLLHRSGAPALRELEQRRGTQRRAEPEVEELLEAPPGRGAFILLELNEPELRHVLQVVRRHPHLLLWHGALLAKIRLTSIDKDQWIRLAIVAREVHLLEPRRPIRGGLAVLAAVGVGRRA